MMMSSVSRTGFFMVMIISPFVFCRSTYNIGYLGEIFSAYNKSGLRKPESALAVIALS